MGRDLPDVVTRLGDEVTAGHGLVCRVWYVFLHGLITHHGALSFLLLFLKWWSLDGEGISIAHDCLNIPLFLLDLIVRSNGRRVLEDSGCNFNNVRYVTFRKGELRLVSTLEK